MRISAIIPNYNHAPFLEERIRSILAQTRRPDEIIFLDDASTDDSLAVVSAFDCFSKVIVNETNSGMPFKQWMKGIEAATGDCVWIAESDDSCEPRMLERLAESMEEGSVLAFCRSTEIGPEGNSLGIQRYQRAFFEDFTMDGPGFIRQYLAPRNVIANASSVLFSRKAALAVDPSFTEFRGAGDILFWTGIAAQGNVSFVVDAMNLFRQHGANRTAEDAVSGRGLQESLRVYRELERRGWLSPLRFRRIIADNRYRLLYGFPDLPDAVRAEALQAWKQGPLVDLIVKVKRLKHLIWK